MDFTQKTLHLDGMVGTVLVSLWIWKAGLGLTECVDVVYWVQQFPIKEFGAMVRACYALVACFELVVFSSITVVYFASIVVSVIVPSIYIAVVYYSLHHCSFCFFILANNRQCIFFLFTFVLLLLLLVVLLLLPAEKMMQHHILLYVYLFSFSLLSIYPNLLCCFRKNEDDIHTASSQYYATTMMA